MRSAEWSHSRALPLAALFILAVGAAAPMVADGGDVVWRRDVPRSLDCPAPVVSKGLLFTYSQDYDRTWSNLVLRIRAFDAVTGKSRWTARGGGRNWDPVSVIAPGIVVAGKRVVVAAERRVSKWELPAVADVAAYDASSGRELWTVRLEGGRYLYRVSAIGATADTVFVVGSRSPVYDPEVGSRSEAMLLALDAASGESRWSSYFSLEGRYDIAYGVVVGGGRVVVSADVRTQRGALATMVRAYEASTGQLLWEDLTTRGTPERLALEGNRIYTMGWISNRRHSFLMAHDLVTGKKLWQSLVRKTLGFSLDAGRGTVAVSGRESSFFPVQSNLRVYDGETGKLLWRRELEEEEISQVFAHRGRLYTIGWPGLLLDAYAIRSGRMLWSLREVDPEEGEDGCRLAHTGELLIATSYGYGSYSAPVRALEP